MYENELIMLFLGLGLVILIAVNITIIKNLPSPKLLLAAFFVLPPAWLFTILEGFFFEVLFNLFEHVCYTASSLLIAVWCSRVFRKRNGVG